MTDAERAREIAGECIWRRRDAATDSCDQLPSVSRCGPCARMDRILAALAATRAEEREKAAMVAQRIGNTYRGGSRADRRDGWRRDRLSACMEIERAIRAGGGT